MHVTVTAKEKEEEREQSWVGRKAKIWEGLGEGVNMVGYNYETVKQVIILKNNSLCKDAELKLQLFSVLMLLLLKLTHRNK